jgi:hypothetical protein
VEIAVWVVTAVETDVEIAVVTEVAGEMPLLTK